MSNNTFQNEGAASALVDEAHYLAEQVRQDVARSREVTRSLQRVNQAIEAAILEIDAGLPRNEDAAASQRQEREA
jgi:hypothetical protein